MLKHLPAFFQATITVNWYPFLLLGEEIPCESKVSYQRTQPNEPNRSQTQKRKMKNLALTVDYWQSLCLGKVQCISKKKLSEVIASILALPNLEINFFH